MPRDFYDPIRNIDEIYNRIHASPSIDLDSRIEIGDKNQQYAKFINLILDERHKNPSLVSCEESASLYKTLLENNTIYIKIGEITDFTAKNKNKNKNMYKCIKEAEKKWLHSVEKFIPPYNPVANIENKISQIGKQEIEQYGLEAYTNAERVHSQREWFFTKFVADIVKYRKYHPSHFYPSNESEELVRLLKSNMHIEKKVNAIKEYMLDPANSSKGLYKSIKRAEEELQLNATTLKNPAENFKYW